MAASASAMTAEVAAIASPTYTPTLADALRTRIELLELTVLDEPGYKYNKDTFLAEYEKILKPNQAKVNEGYNGDIGKITTRLLKNKNNPNFSEFMAKISPETKAALQKYPAYIEAFPQPKPAPVPTALVFSPKTPAPVTPIAVAAAAAATTPPATTKAPTPVTSTAVAAAAAAPQSITNADQLAQLEADIKKLQEEIKDSEKSLDSIPNQTGKDKMQKSIAADKKQLEELEKNLAILMVEKSKLAEKNKALPLTQAPQNLAKAKETELAHIDTQITALEKERTILERRTRAITNSLTSAAKDDQSDMQETIDANKTQLEELTSKIELLNERKESITKGKKVMDIIEAFVADAYNAGIETLPELHGLIIGMFAAHATKEAEEKATSSTPAPKP